MQNAIRLTSRRITPPFDAVAREREHPPAGRCNVNAAVGAAAQEHRQQRDDDRDDPATATDCDAAREPERPATQPARAAPVVDTAGIDVLVVERHRQAPRVSPYSIQVPTCAP
jgi:hypothetical protein